MHPSFDTFDIDPDALWDTTPAPLEGEALHVWRMPPVAGPRCTARLWSVLSNDEQRRAGRLHRAQGRSGFVIARGALRVLLGAYLRRAPDTLGFEYGPRGKPMLAPRGTPLQFNLSHTRGLCVLAFSRRRALGVDVEALDRPLQVGPLARRVLDPVEHDALLRVPETQRKQALLNAWTRKEAFLKATGEGLGGGLREVPVSLAPDEPARLLGDASATGAWDLWALEVGPSHVGALAAAAPAVPARAAGA